MRMAVLMIATGALMASAAHAATDPVAARMQKVSAVSVAGETPAARRAEPTRSLMVCDAEEDAGAVARDVDFGFVTAKQVMAGRTWSGTKCITPNEARRLDAMKLSVAN